MSIQNGKHAEHVPFVLAAPFVPMQALFPHIKVGMQAVFPHIKVRTRAPRPIAVAWVLLYRRRELIFFHHKKFISCSGHAKRLWVPICT